MVLVPPLSYTIHPRKLGIAPALPASPLNRQRCCSTARYWPWGTTKLLIPKPVFRIAQRFMIQSPDSGVPPQNSTRRAWAIQLRLCPAVESWWREASTEISIVFPPLSTARSFTIRVVAIRSSIKSMTRSSWSVSNIAISLVANLTRTACPSGLMRLMSAAVTRNV